MERKFLKFAEFKTIWRCIKSFGVGAANLAVKLFGSEGWERKVCGLVLEPLRENSLLLHLATIIDIYKVSHEFSPVF
jgi:hypothetical protein